MADALTSATTGANAAQPPFRSRLMLPVLLAGVFVAQFDFFVVNVAAPPIERDLQTGHATLELVVGGYVFAYASGMITSGRLGDMFGHRRMFAIGVIAFGLTSLLCGIASAPWQLVAARLAQGLAGSLMVPQTMGLITTEFPVQRRARALAAWGMTAGLGAVAGQALGGLLVHADVAGLGWRLIFLVNVPICAVVALLAPRTLPPPAALRPTSLDPLGAVGTSLALALILVPLTLGRAENWPLWGWICMAAAVVVGALTLWWQQTLTRRGGSPVIDMTLFRTPSFRAGLVAGVSFMLYFGSFMFTLTLLLQEGLGQDAFHAGLIFCPLGVLFSVGSLLSSRLTTAFGQLALVCATALVGLGLSMLALKLFLAGQDTGAAWIMLCVCLIGLGNGVLMPSLIGTALMQVKPAQAGLANGVLQTAQQFANAAGVAAVGGVFFSVLGTRTSGDGYASAMAWAAVIDLGLILAVSLMVWKFKRIAESL